MTDLDNARLAEWTGHSQTRGLLVPVARAPSSEMQRNSAADEVILRLRKSPPVPLLIHKTDDAEPFRDP